MIRVAHGIVHRAPIPPVGRSASGFSLIELMIAMVLGLTLSAGMYVLLASSSRANATQLALARLQDSGHVARETIASDLRSAGHMPCGAQRQLQVFSDTLAAHVVGVPANAAPPPAASAGQPYMLDRGVFLSGSSCGSKTCAPALATALGVPRAGIAVGDRVPGSDVLTIRYLQGDGLPATLATSGGSCSAAEPIAAVSASGAATAGFASGHLALLASCTSAQIFAVTPATGGLQPVSGRFGIPKCSDVGTQPRLFDFDTSMQTSTYYLQLVQDDSSATRRIAALMRRTNGVVNEVVQGVERFDLRYSLRDRDGNSHWLLASQLDRGMSASGAPLQCGADTVAHACSWADVDAVDVALLVNTIDDLPIESGATAWSYRYSIDGDDVRTPKAAMPVTGLPGGRMLRREFRFIVALRSLNA